MFKTLITWFVFYIIDREVNVVRRLVWRNH